jgi:ribonuclease HI
MSARKKKDNPSAPSKDLVRLFTDGACKGNPGPGGWAYILKHPATGKVRDASGAERQTTNNRMELQAVIEGLSVLTRPCHVELVTDSEYVGRGISEWLPNWKSRGWMRKTKSGRQPVLNVDLWQEIDRLAERHELKVELVLGHSGHPENEACDRMAVAAYKALIADLRE